MFRSTQCQQTEFTLKMILNRSAKRTEKWYVEYHHRLLLLKLDKQNGGTIYWPILTVNEA